MQLLSRRMFTQKRKHLICINDFYESESMHLFQIKSDGLKYQTTVGIVKTITYLFQTIMCVYLYIIRFVSVRQLCKQQVL